MAFARFLLSLFVAGSLSGSDGVVTLPPSPVPVPSPTMLPTAADFTMLHITMEANTDKKPTESRKASLLAQIEAELVCEASDPCYIGGIEVVYTSETTTVPIIGEQTTFTWFVNLTAHSSLGAVGETTGNGWAASAEAGLTSIQFQANVLSVVGGTYFTVIDVQATPHAHTAAPSLQPMAEPTSEPTISTLPTPEPTIHTASPSMLITLPPTTIDYAKIYVVMSATCDKKPSNSRTAALQSAIEDSIGCTPSDGCSVDPFRIDYTTSTISTLLGPLNTYTWDVNMTASGPLANVGETTTDKWCRSVESELTSPGFSVSATSVVGATTFAVLDAKAVSRTREPPSMAPTPKTPSGEKPSSIIMVSFRRNFSTDTLYFLDILSSCAYSLFLALWSHSLFALVQGA